MSAISTLNSENLDNLARVVGAEQPDLDSYGYTIDNLLKVGRVDENSRSSFGWGI